MVVGGNCVRLPKRYLDLNGNPGQPFQVAMLLLRVTGLLECSFCIHSLSW